MFRFLSLILLGVVSFYLVLNLGFLGPKTLKNGLSSGRRCEERSELKAVRVGWGGAWWAWLGWGCAWGGMRLDVFFVCMVWSYGAKRAVGGCKVKFIQSFCWLYSMPNLLVIQHLETPYFCGNHVRVVCERVWRKAQECAFKKGLAIGSQLANHQRWTRVMHARELKSHANLSTTGQNFQNGQAVSSQLKLTTRSSHNLESLECPIW